ncbi:MAG: response regulator [Deltaproteobacteria bacterium]|nr:response regulator [Deltaproteobacteria bacterium]
MPFLIKPKQSVGQPREAKDKVLVANANPDFCYAIKEFLAGHGFDVILAKDGVEALQFLEIEMPPIALVDVALPGMYGFEICDFIKNSEKRKYIKIILLASVYDKTRYKRMPTSIYGADDYMEMHHIPDQLVPKIRKLIGKGEQVGKPPVETQPKEFEVVIMQETGFSQKIKEIADRDMKVTLRQAQGDNVMVSLSNQHEEAKRLARIIASDIILYNQEAVEKGIRDGNLYELLKDEIKEGLVYYAKRVPPDVRKNTAYLKNAFEELIGKMKKEMGV